MAALWPIVVFFSEHYVGRFNVNDRRRLIFFFFRHAVGRAIVVRILWEHFGSALYDSDSIKI